jgi:hypothetical protein
MPPRFRLINILAGLPGLHKIWPFILNNNFRSTLDENLVTEISSCIRRIYIVEVPFATSTKRRKNRRINTLLRILDLRSPSPLNFPQLLRKTSDNQCLGVHFSLFQKSRLYSAIQLQPTAFPTVEKPLMNGGIRGLLRYCVESLALVFRTRSSYQFSVFGGSVFR